MQKMNTYKIKHIIHNNKEIKSQNQINKIKSTKDKEY